MLSVTNRKPGENDDDIDDDVLTKQRLVASHADINDEGQTVNIRANGLSSDQIARNLVQTGAMIWLGIKHRFRDRFGMKIEKTLLCRNEWKRVVTELADDDNTIG